MLGPWGAIPLPLRAYRSTCKNKTPGTPLYVCVLSAIHPDWPLSTIALIQIYIAFPVFSYLSYPIHALLIK